MHIQIEIHTSEKNKSTIIAIGMKNKYESIEFPKKSKF